MNRVEYFKNLLKKIQKILFHYSLGFEYYRVKDYENAIKHLTKYLQLQEDEGAVYRTLAKCYEEMEEFQKAIEVLEEGIKQAMKFNHPSMAQEYQQWIEELKSMSF
ncbi:MAG TPA: tetratricopeptide repeat protein [Aquifex aeolicus]|nr:tetratricopeptide repeat protein [Aquifex aeolicus]